MDTNRRIAEWLGWKLLDGDWKSDIYEDLNGRVRELPDYLHSNADAIGLLDVLVERGYGWKLITVKHPDYHEKTYKINCSVWRLTEKTDVYEPSISESICAAIIQLIDKEAGE